jgi:hypothetical protein
MKNKEVSISLSILTLNVNRLNTPIKRHRLVEWIKKTRFNYLLSIRSSTHWQRPIQNQSARMENDIPSK